MQKVLNRFALLTPADPLQAEKDNRTTKNAGCFRTRRLHDAVWLEGYWISM